MATVILHCAGSPNYSGHVGPGDAKDGQEIRFDRGFAQLDDEADDFAKRMSWVNTPGCPHIEIVTEAEAITQRAVAAALDKANREAHGLE
jgi:hypothetical protein